MRVKAFTLSGVAFAGVAGVFAGSQDWVVVSFTDGVAPEALTGYVTGSALTPVSVALVAAALVLAIVGHVFRRVLSVLVVLLGGGLVVLAAGVIGDPAGSVASRVTALTGVSGSGQGDVLASVSCSFWPGVVVVAGVLAMVSGGAALVWGRGWGGEVRRFASDRGRVAADVDRGERVDRISDWDQLSGESDPTVSD